MVPFRAGENFFHLNKIPAARLNVRNKKPRAYTLGYQCIVPLGLECKIKELFCQ
jgi:hypothetical protein